VDIDGCLEKALELAGGPSPWTAIDTLTEVWRETRDPEIAVHVLALKDGLVPGDFLRGVSIWAVVKLVPTGALLQLIIARVRAMVSHDREMEDYLRPLLTWGADPRLADLAVEVLAKETARKGARAVAAQLFLTNADQSLRRSLFRLSETIGVELRSELRELAERCSLRAPAPLSERQLQTVVELRERLLARADEVKASIVHDFKIALSDSTDKERQAEEQESKRRERKVAKVRAFRRDLAQRVELGSIGSARLSLPATVERKCIERGPDLSRFQHLDEVDVRALIEAGFLKPDDAPNGQPSVVELLGFLLKWPGVKCHGWVRSKPLEARLEGLQFEGAVSAALRSDFRLFCEGSEPDDFINSKTRLFAWWD
jgi:hypothetical protein